MQAATARTIRSSAATNQRPRVHYISLQKTLGVSPFACVCSRRIRIEWSEEDGVISLKLVRLVECHSDELAAELVAKFERSSRAADLHKVPVEELRGRIYEILRHLSEWLLTKTSTTSSSVILRS